MKKKIKVSKNKKRPPFLRYAESGLLAEIFFANAIASIIAIRVFLYFTGYPKIGGSGLHIAHMLWGGLLMFLALLLLLFFLNKNTRFIAAIVGGLGFGTFMDELGKFITSDNNYFFKPTFALLYVFFVVLFLILKRILGHRPLTSWEYYGNVFELLKEAAVEDFDIHERNQLHEYLQKSKLSSKFERKLINLVSDIKLSYPRKPNFYIKIKNYLYKTYNRILKTNWFLKFVSLFFIIRGLFVAGAVFYFLYLIGFKGDELINSMFYINIINIVSDFGFFDWGMAISSGASNLLLLFGLLNMHRSFLNSLYYFRYSLLISIFLNQFFAFYHDQLLAVVGLFFDILLLYALDYMIGNSTTDKKRHYSLGSKKKVAFKVKLK
ncbi:hypothetical protein ACFLZ1_02005 [Patescibacteria group bacterium]